MNTRRLPQKHRHIVRDLMLCVLWLCSLAGCHSTQAPQATLVSSRVYSKLDPTQPLLIPLLLPDPAVLIEVRSRNINLRSRVLDSSGQISSDIHLAFLRSAPIYHFMDAARPHQRYTLELTPLQTNRLASVTVNVYALPTGSNEDATLVAAWRNLARGLQFVSGEEGADWAGNLTALSLARQGFEQLRRQEPALWARYFKAYFDYYPLYRYAEALQAANALLHAADELGLPNLSLLSHQLAGQILIEHDAAEDKGHAQQNLQLAQRHFTRARQLARAADNDFETAWAINNAGITFYYQAKTRKALDCYAEALNRAIDLHDTYLQNLIGSNLAVAQEKSGHIDQAIETLLKVQDAQGAYKDPLEAENVLSLLGFDYLKLYRFPQALDVLNQALALSIKYDWAEDRGRNRLLLGQVYRELGQQDKSLTYLQLALPDLETAHDGRAMRRALSLSADIHRMNQRFAAMARDRARQEDYVVTDAERADWLRSSARDAAAQARFDLAIRLYRQSANADASGSFSPLAQLALLHACVLETRLRANPDCSTTKLQSGFDAIQSAQASTSELEGKFLWAQLQAREGRHETARTLMASLVDDIGFYRQSLPGILGAWYWDARRQIFDFYMQLELSAPTAAEQSALDSLLALNRMRNTSLYSSRSYSAQPQQGAEHPSAEAIRTLMARRNQAGNQQALAAAQRGIDQLLLSGADHARAEHHRLSAGELRQELRQLPDDYSVLTFYFSEHKAWAWVGNKQGLKRYELGSGGEIPDLIDNTKANIRTVNNESLRTELTQLGQDLLAPLQHELGARILFLGAGTLSDFPLEALVLDGQFLIRHHQVVNIMSMNDLYWLEKNLGRPLHPASVFLAGDPASPSRDLPELRGTAQELDSVQKRFPQAVITRYQGSKLVRAAFDSDSFSGADLIHIASHAFIDREYPELSRLTLSGGGETGQFLTPNDLKYRPIPAQLVVLSACSTAGLNRFDYDNNLGFVSRFLQQGSGWVLASLWPIPDRTTARFLDEFYKQLAAGADVAGALRRTKLKLLDSKPSLSVSWASFQLFSR